ncbi:MAG: glycosyltransferase family 2 protein, partial [Eubacteriales bacterium]|nr:glycosyltransferase family 2 protein [Eubacteriales bacterium]
MNNKLYMVIPCYNEEEVLPETSKRLREKINSLIEKGKIDKESRIVFVNDGSKDNTQLIVEEIASNDNRVILLNQKNKGVSAARNNALDYCNSIINPRYIAFLDSDDV